MLTDIDLSGGSSAQYRFGGSLTMNFNGVIDGNGHKIIRDAEHTTAAIFNRISESGKISNIVVEVRLNNKVEISGFVGLVNENRGTIENIIIRLTQSIQVPNIGINLLSNVNIGTIKNFVLNFEVPLYGAKPNEWNCICE